MIGYIGIIGYKVETTPTSYRYIALRAGQSADRTSSQDALTIEIWMDLLKGLPELWGFQVEGVGFPQIFSAP